MKIDLQELKRLYADDVFQEPDNLRVTLTGSQLAALVDVVEKAQAVLACDDGNGANNYYSDRDYGARRALESALTPFTESTNEEA